MKILPTRFLRSFLALLLLGVGVTAPLTAAATDYKVHFLRLSFSMACSHDTPETDRKFHTRAVGAVAGLSNHECADERKQIVGVKPASIKVKYDEDFDKFEVIIYLSKADADGLAKITEDVGDAGANRRLLIGAGDKIVSYGYLNSPFQGSDFHIAATSHQAAHTMSRLLVESVVK